MKTFISRYHNEDDFFYAFEVDEGFSVSFFWRDAKMKVDYHLFADLLVFNTTFLTTSMI